MLCKLSRLIETLIRKLEKQAPPVAVHTNHQSAHLNSRLTLMCLPPFKPSASYSSASLMNVLVSVHPTYHTVPATVVDFCLESDFLRRVTQNDCWSIAERFRPLHLRSVRRCPRRSSLPICKCASIPAFISTQRVRRSTFKLSVERCASCVWRKLQRLSGNSYAFWMGQWQPAFGQYWVMIGCWVQIFDQSDLGLMPNRQASLFVANRAWDMLSGRSSTRLRAVKQDLCGILPNNYPFVILYLWREHTDCTVHGSKSAAGASFSQTLADANTRNAVTWTRVDKEISSLNEYLALSTPGPLAAKKVIQLSDAAIKTATAPLVDRRKTLERAVCIQKANPMIRRLSEDRPLDARKLCHSSSREEVRKRLPDGAISADPKLKAKPIVVIAPCAPESTPRQTTATPDSSFYSTAADPSNSKGSDALEEANLTWTERPKYVELSALLSITDDKGATVNSTPKLQTSWIGSDERCQVAKPTGKPTTCADVDIGEFCENRTTTETVKLPISSSTPSKVASLVVDTVVA
ncbi:hypothetical protein CLF_113179 [Clonorchis sinensis]|uniref:Uncharacterized protein n=1 Tax=Clonorchis sinensis TaxID=79923 RepID=G7YMT5_CLOSI|nr:hypothetical protein CLF_113179 [Clonorchis sinensis]